MTTGARPVPRWSPPVVKGVPLDALLALDWRAFWRFFTDQDVAYWGMCAYLYVEYVRPQQLIEGIIGWPLGMAALGITIAGFVLNNTYKIEMKGPGTWLLLAFTTVIVLSSFTAYDPSISFDKIKDWFSWVLIYLLIINIITTRQRFVFFLLVWLMCHYYMSQGGTRQFAGRGFSFQNYGIIGAPGWFANSGEFAIAMCMLFSVSWRFFQISRPHLSKWRKAFVLGMPLTALLGVVGSSSRGAVLALAAVGVVMLLRSKLNVRVVVGVALAAGFAWFIMPAEQKARFDSAGDDKTSRQRKTYWLNGLDIARQHPVLGVGYENWLRYYRQFYTNSEVSEKYGINSVQVSHNIFIQCMAELGYLGLLVFLVLIGATVYINYETRKLVRSIRGPPDRFLTFLSYAFDEAMIGYLVAGFFVTVLYYPFFWINLAFSVALNSLARNAARAHQADASHALRQGHVRRPQPMARRVG